MPACRVRCWKADDISYDEVTQRDCGTPREERSHEMWPPLKAEENFPDTTERSESLGSLKLDIRRECLVGTILDIFTQAIAQSLRGSSIGGLRWSAM